MTDMMQAIREAQQRRDEEHRLAEEEKRQQAEAERAERTRQINQWLKDALSLFGFEAEPENGKWEWNGYRFDLYAFAPAVEQKKTFGREVTQADQSAPYFANFILRVSKSVVEDSDEDAGVGATRTIDCHNIIVDNPAEMKSSLWMPKLAELGDVLTKLDKDIEDEIARRKQREIERQEREAEEAAAAARRTAEYERELDEFVETPEPTEPAPDLVRIVEFNEGYVKKAQAELSQLTADGWVITSTTVAAGGYDSDGYGAVILQRLPTIEFQVMQEVREA